MTNVVIIGGGASGLMAAIAAAEKGAKVTLLEHNDKVGKKILATGNGRCNLSNVSQEPSFYRCASPRYPWSIINQFSMADTLRFFSKLGIFTKNRNGWLYPYSDQAAGVAELLEMEARHQGVKIKTLEEVTDIEKNGEGYMVLTKGWQYPCDKVIVCCGSHASSVEGSSDTGFRLAKKLGHTVLEPMPALVPLKGKDSYYAKWAGVRMDGIIKLEIEDHIFLKERGEILFTEYGISGIAVFQLSRYAVRAVREGCLVKCRLDLMPDFSKEDLIALFNQRKSDSPYKSNAELMIGLLPKKIIPVLAPADASLSRIAENLKDWTVPIKDGISLRQAQVCSGGVDVSELSETLESKLHPGIYFAGEVVDVDGPCGGYNLQWAWSSGQVAGKACAAE
jgi:predicted Rossmann fold flavoprotein